MLHGRHQASFDQVSEFDQGRIVAYRDCGLSFREISQCVGQNRKTAMRIYHCWIQEEMTDQRGGSHPPCCTAAHDKQMCAFQGGIVQPHHQP
ncbi:uncharacterized protein TNCV_2045711 [Trichonephila clavipes]|uniref:Transposase IS30-like HTH domain-containing protein n=1 Tax=Trichonephila clavipes TaxID=2585209 RepID=A0A8X6SVI8_TRICX|nr:uncharacterized protein TNCV_2045711 [Trichonephila clavipes]